MRRITAIVAVSFVAAACAGKRAAHDAQAPAAAAEGEAAMAGADDFARPEATLEDYVAELAGYEEALRSEGVMIADATTLDAGDVGGAAATEPMQQPAEEKAKAGEAPAADAAPAPPTRAAAKRRSRGPAKDRCERICTIAEATCGLSDRICELAQRHPGDERYRNACARAEQDCEVASHACRDCAK